MNNLSAGNLICYDNQDKLLIAVVKSADARKVVAINNHGAEISLPSDRVSFLGGSLRSDLKNLDYLPILEELLTKAEVLATSIDLPFLWETVASENKAYTISELAREYFSTETHLEQLALRLSLNQNKIFFKRQKDLYLPRESESVEQLKQAAAAAERQLEIYRQTKEYLSKRLANEDCIESQEIKTNLNWLVRVAVGFDHIDPKTHKLISTLISEITTDKKIKLYGNLQAQAYQLAIKAKLLEWHQAPSLIRNNLRQEFSAEQSDEAQQIISNYSINKSVLEDFTDKTCFTIDDANTRDMDDALSVSKNSAGYEIGIHITDVANCLSSETMLDLVALNRASSVYHPAGVINMLPRSLSEELLSLKENEDRQCLSLIFNINNTFEILNYRVCSSLIKSKNKLSYQEVDESIINQTREEITILNSFAKHRQEMRDVAGARNLPKRTLKIILDDNFKVRLEEQEENTPAHQLVAEMMILANEYFARFCTENQIPALYRCQKAPEQSELKQLEQIDDSNPAKEYLRRSVMKPSYISTKAELHYGLGLNHYLQATSPIRRYLDLLIQRQICAHLNKQNFPYTEKKLLELLKEIEPRLSIANKSAREAERFWLLHYLKQNPEQTKALPATIIRNDKKYALIEINNLVMTCFCKVPKELKPGDQITVKLKEVKPEFDDLQLEFIEKCS